MIHLILRIAKMLDYATEHEVREILLAEGDPAHTEENVFLATKSARVLRQARADDKRRYPPSVQSRSRMA